MRWVATQETTRRRQGREEEHRTSKRRGTTTKQPLSIAARKFDNGSYYKDSNCAVVEKSKLSHNKNKDNNYTIAQTHKLTKIIIRIRIRATTKKLKKPASVMIWIYLASTFDNTHSWK